MVTILLLILALVALGVLAIRYGADSRDGAWSKEQELASYGFASSEPAPEPSVAGGQPAATAGGAPRLPSRAYSMRVTRAAAGRGGLR